MLKNNIKNTREDYYKEKFKSNLTKFATDVHSLIPLYREIPDVRAFLDIPYTAIIEAFISRDDVAPDYKTQTLLNLVGTPEYPTAKKNLAKLVSGEYSVYREIHDYIEQTISRFEYITNEVVEARRVEGKYPNIELVKSLGFFENHLENRDDLLDASQTDESSIDNVMEALFAGDIRQKLLDTATYEYSDAQSALELLSDLQIKSIIRRYFEDSIEYKTSEETVVLALLRLYLIENRPTTTHIGKLGKMVYFHIDKLEKNKDTGVVIIKHDGARILVDANNYKEFVSVHNPSVVIGYALREPGCFAVTKNNLIAELLECETAYEKVRTEALYKKRSEMTMSLRKFFLGEITTIKEDNTNVAKRMRNLDPNDLSVRHEIGRFINRLTADELNDNEAIAIAFYLNVLFKDTYFETFYRMSLDAGMKLDGSKTSAGILVIILMLLTSKQ